jgi:NADH-quinone oxidoreductase subunit N
MDALIVIFITGLLSLFISFAKKPLYVLLTACTGLVTGAILLVNQLDNPSMLFTDYKGLLFDNTAISYSLVAILFALLAILSGYKSFKENQENIGDYTALLLFSLVGAMCMVSFTDLFMFFLGLEILSIPIYVMAGTAKKDIRSSEASIKYFLTGAFATGILLFGIAWLYGAVGSFDIQVIAHKINMTSEHSSLLYVGLLLILAAFLFKVGAAPFHFWSPDVYSGSPTVVTGYMAAVVKLGAFGAFIKLFSTCFPSLHEFWAPAIVGLSVLTMFVGNLSALTQSTFKRLLAYSSITHVGYALLTIISKDSNSQSNLLFYLFAYGFSVIALITISMLINDKEDKLDGFKGLAKRNPFLGFVSILALLSLAGVPPLVGFFGKYLVFAGAITDFPVLVVIAIINSGIGIYYYLKTIMTIISKDDVPSDKLEVSSIQYLVLALCTIGLLVGGMLISHI